MSDSETAVPATHQRIFLVVVDDSEELNIALTYACLRARNSGGRVALLYVIEPSDFQHWIAVEDIMRRSAGPRRSRSFSVTPSRSTRSPAPCRSCTSGKASAATNCCP